jgi:hypothetical protein
MHNDPVFPWFVLTGPNLAVGQDGMCVSIVALAASNTHSAVLGLVQGLQQVRRLGPLDLLWIANVVERWPTLGPLPALFLFRYIGQPYVGVCKLNMTKLDHEGDFVVRVNPVVPL